MDKSVIIDRIEVMQELYNNGVLIKDIASEIGVDATTVGRYIKRYPEIFNPNLHRRYRKISDSESEEIYQEWLNSNKSMNCIAKERNLATSTVSKYITMRLRKGKS